MVDDAYNNSNNESSPSEQNHNYIVDETNNTSNSNSTATNVICNATPTPSNLNLKQESIDMLLKRTGYPMQQENGQRKYGPPPDWDPNVPEPDRSCEAFVGKIPRDCFEDELIPLLEKIGKVYEFRLMMEYSGYNRGYGFVMYTSREDAKKAVQELNNYEIRKGRMIGVCRSVDNCRLFVGGIPKNKKKEEILEEMKKVTEDVINVIVYPSAHDKTKNRGFAFVQYASHRAAAIARRKLIPNRIQLFGQPIAVDWAEPEPEVDETVMATVKVLYVRNLMLSTTEEQIKQVFENIKENSVERVKKMKDFAFVHFKEREDAINAMNIMNGSTIDDSIIEVSLSKPVDKNSLKLMPQTSPSPTSSLALLTAAATATPLIGVPNDLNLLSLNLVKPVGPMDFSAIQFANTTSSPLSQIPGPYQYTILNYSTGSNPPTNEASILSPQSQAPILNHQATMSQLQNAANNLSMKTNLKSSSSLRNGSNNLVRGSAGLYRSSYYNLAKNNNGANGSLASFGSGNLINSIKKQASSQDVPYDIYTALKPIPILPYNTINQSNTIKYANRMPCQVLEEICLKDGYPQPIYSLHTTTGHDAEGREVQLFLYKIMIPGLFNSTPISSNKLLSNLEDAKNDAAEFFLSQLTYQQQLTAPQLIDLNNMYHQPQIATQPQVNQHQTNGTPTSTPPPASVPPLQANPNTPNLNAQIMPNDTNYTVNQQSRNIYNEAYLAAAGVTTSPSNLTHPINSVPGAPIMPQFIIDPTGQYILTCPPTSW